MTGSLLALVIRRDERKLGDVLRLLIEGDLDVDDNELDDEEFDLDEDELKDNDLNLEYCLWFL